MQENNDVVVVVVVGQGCGELVQSRYVVDKGLLWWSDGCGGTGV